IASGGRLANDLLQGRTVRALVPELRRHLQQQLPDYMIPVSIAVLDEMPLTPNGKVDRAALPLPEADGPGRQRMYAAPRTPVEQTIARAWSELLGVRQISVHDDFFGELGGHSLLATQVCSRLRDAFHVDVSLRAFFESPTIAGIARLIEEDRRDRIEPVDEPLTRLAGE
ncbi:MAG TPA: phosphopantetheine-binding protein, partial [Vicinamibacterales bacterium]|nr:phosphopantetheine-binding protein [Vicinamibacterales bacterium]